jgi:hypothetical protein
MANDFIPRPDNECAAWAVQFLTVCNADPGALGLSGKQLVDIKNGVDAFIAALAMQTAALAAADGATADKRAARAALEQLMRGFTRGFQTLPAMTDSLRAQLGITVPTGSLTPSPAPTTAPSVSVELPARLTHTLRLTDSATPTRTAKPRGVHGAEVWFALAEPGSATPPPMENFRFHTLATRDSITRMYKPEDGGRTAFYQLRWVSTRGEKGPWSEVTSATVAA